MAGHTDPNNMKGGLAQYCVEHREVAWMFLAAALAWGAFAFTRLAQQEDPTIPIRGSVIVTRFPGANAAQVEDLVTKQVEQKVTELSSVEETRSLSRIGASIVYVTLRPAPQRDLNQEWEKIRAKLQEIELPEGAQPPFLDTDFGNTVTLLFAIASRNTTRAESLARARLLRDTLDALRRGKGGAQDRAAVAAFFPPAISPGFRRATLRQFAKFLAQERLASDIRQFQGASFILCDFKTDQSRAGLESALAEFARRIVGTDGELHPDFPDPLVLMGAEDPLGALLAKPMPDHSYRRLEKIAEDLKDNLKLLADVGKVTIIGNVPETLYLYLSQRTLPGVNLDPGRVKDMIAARNAIIPGGIFRAVGQNFPVKISGQYQSEDELNNVIIGLAGKERASVYLRDVFDVQRGYVNPVPFQVDVLQRAGGGELERRRSVLLAVEMKESVIIGHFNRQVEEAVRQFEPLLPEGVSLAKISDQPRSVEHRIRQFAKCFLEAVAVVIVVCLFLMNWRSALVVALAIPLTVALTLGGMHLLGIPLHQISIAALIIALGMLVDDPVVASDAINRELHHGRPRETAAWLGPFKLRHAILYGTVINILAFLPLAILPGDTGAFIYALPVVVSLALIASRIVSMTFIPLLGYYLLKGQKGLEEGGDVRSFFLFRPVDLALAAALPRYRRFLGSALRRFLAPILVAYGLLAGSFLLTRFFGTQFFPPAERNQLLINVELPQSASISRTRSACDTLAAILKSRREIESAAIFIGGTAPRFYYNLEPLEPADNLAQVLINTRAEDDIPVLMTELRDTLDREVAGARCVVRQLDQGPGIETPIQIRISGPDLTTLRALADRVADELRRAGGYKVYDDLGLRVPSLEIRIDQDKANLLGVSNPSIGELTRGAFSDYPVTELREGNHRVPIIIRLRAEERSEAGKIKSLYVFSALEQMIPLESFARVKVGTEFPVIPHFNKLRTATVKSFSRYGELPSAVLARAEPAIASVALPPQYRLEFAGEAKELRSSQAEMIQVMAISLCLIALAMVMQFRSVVKSLVVMLTVPLGLIGAFTGLAVTRAEFGFTALLGIVSLAGVIVSHIIVLSDYIEEARAEGVPLEEALVHSGLVRLRAVLVTVLATVGGLIPLFLSGGALWKPLTAVHIFGLLFATVLTLVILPVLYYVFCAKLKLIKWHGA